MAQDCGTEDLGRLRADRGTMWGNLVDTRRRGDARYICRWESNTSTLFRVLTGQRGAELLAQRQAMDDPAREMVDIFSHAQGATPLDRLMYVDIKTVLPESLLLLTDKMGMASSLEVRVPFLDNRLVDFVCRVPSHYRLHGFTLKRLLKKLYRESSLILF